MRLLAQGIRIGLVLLVFEGLFLNFYHQKPFWTLMAFLIVLNKVKYRQAHEQHKINVKTDVTLETREISGPLARNGKHPVPKLR